MLPPNIDAAFREKFKGGYPLPERGELAVGTRQCEGSKFHSPTPLTLVCVQLSPEPDPKDFYEPEAIVCGNCEANLKVLNTLMLAYDGALPWTVRREFGNEIRRLAKQGWDYRQGKADK